MAYMIRFIFVSLDFTYRDLDRLLKDEVNMHAFPVVDSTDTMVLIGSIKRRAIIKMLNGQLCRPATTHTKGSDTAAKDDAFPSKGMETEDDGTDMPGNGDTYFVVDQVR